MSENMGMQELAEQAREITNAKHCFKCGRTMRREYVFCPACGAEAIRVDDQKPKRARDYRNLRRAIIVLSLPIFLIGYGVVWNVTPWFQNLAMNLRSDRVGLELQVGNNSSNWLGSGSTFRAKVSLPYKLSDSVTVKLEKLVAGVWVEQGASEVRNSSTVPLVHTFLSAEKQDVRASLYSGTKLIQTSNVKTVQGVKAPKGFLGKSGNVYFRYFTKPEYDSVSTPGCGSYCWGMWVSTPTKSTLTMWIVAEGRAISEKVKVTTTEVGVLRKVILPSLGLGKSGSVHIESRPATAEEIREANKPKPRPKPTQPEVTTPDNCNGFSLTEALDRRTELRMQMQPMQEYLESVGGVAGALLDYGAGAAATAQQYVRRLQGLSAELYRVDQEIERCS
jgi:hypothetical protein